MKPENCPKAGSCTDPNPCGICPKRWCEWAACNRRALRSLVDGWAMCGRHRNTHYALLAEAAGTTTTCVGCSEPFTSTDTRRTRCDKCRRVRIDRRPTYAKRQKAA